MKHFQIYPLFNLAFFIGIFFTACGTSTEEVTQKDVHFATYHQPSKEIEKTPKKAEFGYLQGSFSFPSDGIPEDMRIVAHNIETGEEIAINYQNQPNYELKVPEGQYFVFAETEAAPDYRAYFTEFVTCGLSIDCPSHKKIIVVVSPNMKMNDINPADWYNVE
ncbi:MAG: hypothetical protein ACKVTZ_12915 [Bacteroidia bacterium]